MHLSQVVSVQMLTTLISLISLFLFVAYPMATIVRKSFFDGSILTTKFFEKIFSSSIIFTIPLRNTLIVSSFVTLFSVFIGIIFGYLLSRTDMPIKNVMGSLLNFPYIIPSFALSMSWIILFNNRGLIESVFNIDSPFPAYGQLALIIVQTIHLFPLSLMSMEDAFGSMDPNLEESGRIHGGSKFYIFRRITLPVLTPTILSAAALTFSYAMAEFAPALLLGLPANFYVLSSEIYFQIFSSANFNLASALSIILMSISILLIFGINSIMGKKRYITIGGKGARPEVIHLGKWKYPVLFFCLAFAFVVIIIPISSLVVGATIKVWGKGYILSNFTLDNIMNVFNLPVIQRAFYNTLVLSIIASLAAALLGVMLAFLSIRSKTRLHRLIDYIVFMPYAIPGTVIGLMMILSFGVYPFSLYGTLYILLIAYIVRFLPYSFRVGSSTLMQIDESLEEQGRIAGGSWFRTFRKIILPLMKGGLISSFLVIFISTMKETSATPLLQTIRQETVATTAMFLFSYGDYGNGASLSLILTLITLSIIIIARKFTKIKIQ